MGNKLTSGQESMQTARAIDFDNEHPNRGTHTLGREFHTCESFRKNCKWCVAEQKKVKNAA